MQKYHDEPKQYKGYLKSALAACSCRVFNGNQGGRLDLIPSTLNLMEIETSKRGTESKLRAYLKEKATGYDYVIIDCPPTVRRQTNPDHCGCVARETSCRCAAWCGVL